MRNKSLVGWNFTSKMEGLAVFANLIDEMTFNYTYDSYKAPALNIISLLDEAHETVLDIENGMIKEEGMRSVLEELSKSFKDDEVMAALLQDMGMTYLCFNAWTNFTNREILNCIVLLKQQKIGERYFIKLKETLSELIKTKGNREKKKIENLTRIFVTHLKYLGYSEEYIYAVNLNFFFSSGTRIDDENAVDLYFSLYDGIVKKYKVVNIGNPLFKSLKNAFSKDHDVVDDTLHFSFSNPVINRFSIRRKNSQVFIITEVKANDPYMARQLSLQRIHRHSRTFRFYHHKDELSVQNECLVIEEASHTVIPIKKPIGNIVHCEDMKPFPASVMTSKTYNRLSYAPESIQRIDSSKQLHENALVTDNLENQFVNLFTALEVLIPKDINSKNARIAQIYETIVPYLCVNYYRKLIGAIDSSLKLWNKVFYKTILSKVTEGTDDIEKLAALMVLKKYDGDDEHVKKELNLLYEQLTADKFYLMRHRMFDMYTILSKPESILSFLERHEERIKWHVDRIYRTRNMIVHGGRSPHYIATMVENLHSYYDSLVNQLIEDNLNMHYNKIELSYTATSIRYKSYKNMLQSARGETIDESNLLAMVFNK